MELHGFDNAHNKSVEAVMWCNVMKYDCDVRIFRKNIRFVCWKIYCKLLSGFFYAFHSKVYVYIRIYICIEISVSDNICILKYS